MRNLKNCILFAFLTAFMWGCGGTSWVIRRDKAGGVIGYRNYGSSEDATEAINKLIHCRNYSVVSDELQTSQSTVVMPMQTSQATNGNAYNNWGTTVNYQQTTHGTQYVPMTVNNNYRTLIYRCEDATKSQIAGSAEGQFLFQNPDSSLAPRLATVNMPKVIRSSKFGMSAKRQLDQVFNAEKVKLESEEQVLKQMLSDFQEHKSDFTSAEKSEKQADFKVRVERYQANVKSKQEMIQKLEKELSTPIIQGIMDTIKDIAVKKGYTLVRDSDGGSSDDLTDEVIEQYNKKTSEKKSTNGKAR